MYVSLLSILINIIANYVLVPRFDHLGIAATASTVLFLNALILILGLKKDEVSFDLKKLTKTFVLIIIGCVSTIFAQHHADSLIRAQYHELVDLPKIISILILTVNGLLTVAFFTLIARVRLGTTLAKAYKEMRRRK